MDPMNMGFGMGSTDSKAWEESHSRRLSRASTAIGEHAATTHHNHKTDNIVEYEATMVSIAQYTRFLRLPIQDHIKTLFLLYLSLVMLPLSLVLAYLLSNPPLASRLSGALYLLLSLVPGNNLTTPAAAAAFRDANRAAPCFRQKTVLVTGINMTKGLTLARAFHLAGHRVVGADFDVLRSSVWLPAWLGLGGRQFSNACAAVYSLERLVPTGEGNDEGEASRKYVDAMIEIMDEEKVDLWVSCSGVASAVEDGLVSSILSRREGGEGTRKVVQFDAETTKKFHEKSSFVRYMQELKLSVPETHEVTSQAQATKILLDSLQHQNAKGRHRKFILKPVGMDDAHRGNMTLLPLSGPAARDEAAPGEATEAYVRTLPISAQRPWILQQFISGNREYCTHALVVAGEVRVFVACESSEMLMHYRALAADDALRRRMLEFTQAVAAAEKEAAGKKKQQAFTGHLSFDFMVERDPDSREEEMHAIECNPRAHTAVVLFAMPGVEMRDMVGAYMTVFEGKEERKPGLLEYRKWGGHIEQFKPPAVVGPSADVAPRYWLGHDLVVLVLLPLLKLVVWPFSLSSCISSCREFAEHFLFWKEGTFELWDPWPFVALYHVYWPMVIVETWWRGERWSRVNVSTTKMFAC